MDSKTECRSVLAIARDITEEVEAKEKLLIYTEKLEKTVSELEEFAFIVPLVVKTSILQMAKL